MKIVSHVYILYERTIFGVHVFAVFTTENLAKEYLKKLNPDDHYVQICEVWGDE